METNDILLTREEVADILRIKPRTVDFYRREGRLKAIPLNPQADRKKGFRYSKADIYAYVNQNNVNVKETRQNGKTRSRCQSNGNRS